MKCLLKRKKRYLEVLFAHSKNRQPGQRPQVLQTLKSQRIYALQKARRRAASYSYYLPLSIHSAGSYLSISRVKEGRSDPDPPGTPSAGVTLVPYSPISITIGSADSTASTRAEGCSSWRLTLQAMRGTLIPKAHSCRATGGAGAMSLSPGEPACDGILHLVDFAHGLPVRLAVPMAQPGRTTSGPSGSKSERTAAFVGIRIPTPETR